MATPDHTVLARPSDPPDGKIIPMSDGPPCSADTVEVTLRRREKMADIAIATYAIQCLLIDSDAYARAQAKGLPTEPVRWPLCSPCSEDLHAAIHYLNEYARMLGREPRMHS